MNRVAVLGVGNRLRGDDGVGPIVIDGLREAGLNEGLFDCGTAPENYIAPALELEPEGVLFVDACAFGGHPGEFRLFSRQEIDELAMALVSTHTLPLAMTVELIALQSPARIALLGVQPAQVEFGLPLSPAVAAALPTIVTAVRDWISA